MTGNRHKALLTPVEAKRIRNEVNSLMPELEKAVSSSADPDKFIRIMRALQARYLDIDIKLDGSPALSECLECTDVLDIINKASELVFFADFGIVDASISDDIGCRWTDISYMNLDEFVFTAIYDGWSDMRDKIDYTSLQEILSLPDGEAQALRAKDRLSEEEATELANVITGCLEISYNKVYEEVEALLEGENISTEFAETIIDFTEHFIAGLNVTAYVVHIPTDATDKDIPKVPGLHMVRCGGEMQALIIYTDDMDLCYQVMPVFEACIVCRQLGIPLKDANREKDKNKGDIDENEKRGT